MVYVPAGEFTMGSAAGDANAFAHERPQHRVYLDAFWIDRTEVTNSRYRAFVEATGYQTTAERLGCGRVWTGRDWDCLAGVDWQHPQGRGSDLSGLDHHPVVQVSWYDAAAYCAWRGARLPTEAEWEKAARGTQGGAYPWGDDAVSGQRANYCTLYCEFEWSDTSEDDRYDGTAPVGAFPSGASPYGVLDVAGNVWEWVGDWYGNGYYGRSPAANPAGPAEGAERVMRGGSWGSSEWWVRAATRSSHDPAERYSDIGFRCASTSPGRGEF